MHQNLYQIFPNQYYVDLCLYQYGYEKCAPLHSYGPFVRNHYLFHYVISGSGSLWAQDSGGQTHVYPIHAGQGFLIFPQQVTTYHADEETPWEYTWIEFDGLRAKEAMMLSGLSMNSPVYSSADRERLKHMMETLLDMAEHPEKSSYALIGQLFSVIDDMISSSASRKTPGSGKMSDFYIKESLTFIEENFHNEISVEDIAAFCNLSRGYLSKIFVRNLGKSPQEFLISYRMSKAAQLLQVTKLSIKDISNAVGYPNQLHFSRAFKNVNGISPQEWRKSHSELHSS